MHDTAVANEEKQNKQKSLKSHKRNKHHVCLHSTHTAATAECASWTVVCLMLTNSLPKAHFDTLFLLNFVVFFFSFANLISSRRQNGKAPCRNRRERKICRAIGSRSNYNSQKSISWHACVHTCVWQSERQPAAVCLPYLLILLVDVVGFVCLKWSVIWKM